MSRSRPQKSRPRKAPRHTVTFYVRIPRELHDRIVEVVGARGYPHSLTSVASEALAVGMETIAPTPSKETQP